MTRTLSLLGGALPAVMIDAKNDNETGFWESQAVVLLNDEILLGLDSEWDDVFSFMPKRYLSNFDRVYLGRAVELLDKEFNGSELIILKDPRISVLTEFWDRALREAGYAPHYIIMVRNPLEVAESLRCRNGFPRQKSLLLWGGYMIAADRETRGGGRTFIAYDQLMDDWRSVRDRIESDVGVPFPRDTATAANEIDRYLDRRLRHHDVSANDLLNSKDVPDEIKTLFGIFLNACQGSEVDQVALSSIELELQKMEALVGPVVADLRVSSRASARNIAELEGHNAAARERVDRLERQLADEQALRLAEAECAAKSAAQYEERLGEMVVCISEAGNDRDRAVAEAMQRDQENMAERDALEQRVAAVMQELRGQERALIEVRDALKKTAEELSASQDELRKANLEVTRVQEESQRQVERAKANFEKELQAAREARSRADAAARENESRLAQQYQELATLTNLLRDREQRSERAEDHFSWIAAVQERLSDHGRWWAIMPTTWRRKRQLKSLQMAGLFDAEAYLRLNPDVAAVGMDPLDHYVRHGVSEDRPRG